MNQRERIKLRFPSFLKMKKVICVLIVLLATNVIFAQEILGSKREAFMLLPATAVASGAVMNFEYSPSGNLIFLKRMAGKEMLSLLEMKPPKEKIRSHVFNVKTGISKEIPLDDPNGTLEVTILGDDQHLFFSDRTRPTYQGFYNLMSGAIAATKLDLNKIFFTGNVVGFGWLMVEESETDALIVTPQGANHKLTLGSSIGIQQPYKQDQNFIYAAGYSRPFGKYYNLVIRKTDFSVQPIVIPKQEFFSLEASGVDPIFSIQKSDHSTALRYEYLIRSEELSSVMKTREAERRRAENLKSIIPKSVDLSIEDTLARVSPSQKTVAYITGGALLIREITPIDSKLAEKAEESKLKAKAIQEAKQVGTAINIFAADNDDQLPSGEDFNQKLGPYLKNPKVLDGFTFNSKYKNMGEMKDPANEEMGFKSAPGGRAVVYGDGSVRWKPNS
jgi:hypothetical protein